MKYPMLNNWLLFKRRDRYTYYVRDCLSEDTFIMEKSLAQFAKKLNGKENPYLIDSSYTDEEVNFMLDTLNEGEFLRYSRFLHSFSGEILFSLWFPKRSKILQIIAWLSNKLLLLLWFPIFFIGIILFCTYLPMDNSNYFFVGYFISTISNLCFHEIGHAFAAVAYKAPVFELGIMLHHFIPGAYVLIDTKKVRNPMQRIQIFAAGLETNFMWAGIFFILSCQFPTYGFAGCVAGINSSLNAIVNLLFVDGLDGTQVLAELLGIENLFDSVKQILFHRTTRKKILRKGFLGHTIYLICIVIYLMQITLPFLSVIGILEVILCFIY